jgi:hypothetical protein
MAEKSVNNSFLKDFTHEISTQTDEQQPQHII